MNENTELNLASGISAFEAKDFARAMQLLNPLADEGEPEAQYRLAIMYQNGLGVVRNEALAFKWMKSAANQAHDLAEHGLGFMYMEGDCIEQNAAKAIEWFTRAANKGLAGSQTSLAMIYDEGIGDIDKDPELAKHWYQKAGFSEK